MTQTKETGYSSTLSQKFSSADTTMYVATAPTVTAGRIYLTNGSQKEWVSFSGVSGNTLTGCVRGLSKTADPATVGTGLNRLAGTPIKLVMMHDQLLDKQQAETPLIYAKTYATTAARDTALGADGAAAHPYTSIYVTATGLFYNYSVSSNAREEVSTGTVTANASTTVAGKVEEATLAEITAMTAAGATGAQLFVNPATVKLIKDYCIVVNSGTQSISDNTATLINLDTYTTNNTYMDNTANKIKIETPGTYLIIASCGWNGSSITDAYSSLTLYKNLSTINGQYFVDSRMNTIYGGSGIDMREHISVITNLVLDDLISIEAYQKNSGSGARTLTTATLQVIQLV